MTDAPKPTSKPWEVWYAGPPGGWTLFGRYRWCWWARFVAWEHTTRGWFRYEVRP